MGLDIRLEEYSTSEVLGIKRVPGEENHILVWDVYISRPGSGKEAAPKKSLLGSLFK